MEPAQRYLENLKIRPDTRDLIALSRDLLGELRGYFSVPEKVSDAQLLELCKKGSAALTQEWRDKKVETADPASILKFYAETQSYCYELVGLDLEAPEARKRQLAEFASVLERFGKKKGLDFGSGIGSTGIYLIQSGLSCEFADVSATNLGFIRARLANRKLTSTTHLLPEAVLPSKAYDFILAMDVLEHVVDPIATLRQLRDSLKPGGLILFNVIAGHDDNDPLHIMHDPFLIRKQIRGLGMKKICAIGEFKVYQQVTRPQALNALCRFLDTSFWTVRVTLKGH